MDRLIRYSGLRTSFTASGLTCDARSVVDQIKRNRTQDPKSNLELAISRNAYSIEMSNDVYPWDGTRYEPTIKRGKQEDQAYEMVHEAYRKHKIGLREVREPFIRKSARSEGPRATDSTITRIADRVNIFTSATGGSFTYSGVQELRFVVVDGCPDKSEFCDPPVEVCFVMVSGPPVTPMVSDILKALEETIRAGHPIYKKILSAEPELSQRWNIQSISSQTHFEREKSKLGSVIYGRLKGWHLL